MPLLAILISEEYRARYSNDSIPPTKLYTESSILGPRLSFLILKELRLHLNMSDISEDEVPALGHPEPPIVLAGCQLL
jgi:hypothetical protein